MSNLIVLVLAVLFAIGLDQSKDIRAKDDQTYMVKPLEPDNRVKLCCVPTTNGVMSACAYPCEVVNV